MFIILRIVIIMILFLSYAFYLFRRTKSINSKVYQFISEKNYTEANKIIDDEIKINPNYISNNYRKLVYLYEYGDLNALKSLIESIRDKKIKMGNYKIYIYNFWIKALILTNNLDEVYEILDDYNLLINNTKAIEKKYLMIPHLLKFHEGNYEESKIGLEKILSLPVMNSEKIICNIYMAKIYRHFDNFEKMNEFINYAINFAKGSLYETYIRNEFQLEDHYNAII